MKRSWFLEMLSLKIYWREEGHVPMTKYWIVKHIDAPKHNLSGKNAEYW